MENGKGQTTHSDDKDKHAIHNSKVVMEWSA